MSAASGMRSGGSGRCPATTAWLTLVLVMTSVWLGGCSISLPWEKDTTTASTTVSVTSPAAGGETFATTTGTGQTTVTSSVGGSSTTRTTRPGTAGYGTPEAAVKAVAPAGWALKVVARESSRAEVWAGPPQSEFVTAYIVQRGANGWVVTDERPLDGGDPGGYEGDGYLIGGPWYEADFPEIFAPGSDLYVPFRTDAYPRPQFGGYPQDNAGAQAVWLSLGEMLNYLKEGDIPTATLYVNADFYRHFYFDFFNPGEPTDFYAFELTGWQDAGGDHFQIWANLYSRDATSRYLSRAVFTGVALGDGTGLMVWVDIWVPVEL